VRVTAQASDLMPRKLRISRYLILKALPLHNLVKIGCGSFARSLQNSRMDTAVMRERMASIDKGRIT
jgi:hypothetical protein